MITLGVLGFDWEAMAFWVLGYFYSALAFLWRLFLTILNAHS
jgi:hypothetical protein